MSLEKLNAQIIETLFENIQEGVMIQELVFDENHHAVDYLATNVNSAFESISGITRENALGKKASVLYRTGTAPFLETYSRVVASGKTEHFDIYWEPLKINLSIFVVPLGENQFATIFIDVTDTKNALMLQRQSEQKYLDLFNRYPAGLILSNVTDGSMISCNNYVVKMLGYPSREACISNYSAEKHYVSAKDRMRMLTKLKKNGRIEDFEVELKDCNGKHFWISYSAHIEDNILEGAAIIITEKKKAEALLLESEERYRRLANASTEAIIITFNGKVIECNQQLSNMYGYSIEEILNLDMKHLVHPDDWELVRNNIRNNVCGPYQHRGIHKDGSVLHLEIRADTIQINGKDHRLTVIRDITELMAMQEELFQSEKMRAIGQLAGGIAHDFNNQLAGIVGYADILREELANNAELSHYVDNILLSTKRASDLTFQLLAFARKGKYLSIPINMHKILGEVIGILERTIDRKISIKQHLEAQKPVIKGDPTQIQNTIMNIALNARDAMPDGGEIIFSTIDTELDTAFCTEQPFDITPGKHLRLSVQDSGTGMDEATKGKIFEPFFTTKSPGKGTGMGLASVYGTIKNHNGAITVESYPGSGTNMVLFFPLDTPGAESAVDNSKPTEVLHGDASILLIDDDSVVLDVATSMLKKCGYQVLPCKSGKEAIALFQKNHDRIHLVLLDLIMPELNGRDTFHALKKIDPNVRVLLSSGYSINGEAQQILDEGATAFIQKPFRRAELSQKISEILHQESS